MSLFGRSGPSPEECAREDAIKQTLTANLQQALKSLQHKHINSEEPIYSEDSANAVCNVIEAVFLHGLKATMSHKLSNALIGSSSSKDPQPNFWGLLLKFTHNDVISHLNHLGQITSEIGMCRAWTRIALNDGVLESYLDAMLGDQQTVRKFYKNTAYLRDGEQSGIFKRYVQGLSHFAFQLSYNASMLNLWTNTPLVLCGLMEAHTTPAAIVSPNNDGATHTTHRSATSVSPSNLPTPSSSNISPSVNFASKRRHDTTSALKVPHNTPMEFSPLSAQDIDDMRKLALLGRRESDGSSTGTSQISHPDPGEVYSISPVLPPLTRTSQVSSSEENSAGSNQSPHRVEGSHHHHRRKSSPSSVGRKKHSKKAGGSQR